MSNKMLIDASHPEETRVVVTRGNRIEEFDFESESKKQLKGNIYLARVTRVEPSLQAAFVEYGGNRHGFLAFSEIHPDYYQIPVADRQALLAAEAVEDDEDDEDNGKSEQPKRKRRRSSRGRATTKTAAPADEEADANDDKDTEASAAESEADVAVAKTKDADDKPATDSIDGDSGETEVAADAGEREADKNASAASPADDGDEEQGKGPSGSSMAAHISADVISEPLPNEEADRDTGDEEQASGGETSANSDGEVKSKPKGRKPRRTSRSKRSKAPEEPAKEDADNGDDSDNGDDVESVGAEDALEELPNRRRVSRRQYKIQEVIKRRQILLVQVVKEERGNKGAALTTYLSLAGRYSVLMPNTARGGGISRKITNLQDRKRLKEVVKGLDVPQGMGVILRTAGANRTKAEIKRDYEYLMRLWMTIRGLTLESTAPALVHEEGSLIKRSVRDLYNKDISEILVAGDEGYREAKDFMRMLMPSHAKAVQPYKDVVPIFARNGIEAQLDRMLQPQVTLKSGGYIIINQTEALVAIDVNSGRSTREHSIEDTALQTNLEAAEEVARQLRLRDLAGLIVIDFIDMEEKRNNRSVEKRLKECLKHDRARIQVGRISHFGLLEMSRQRIRASVLESTMQACDVCHGTGHIRSESSVALHVVRGIEEHLLKESTHDIVVKTPAATALYVLNNKRAVLSELEERFGLSVSIEADETLGQQYYQIVKAALAEQQAQPAIERAMPEPDDAVGEASEDDDRASEDGGGKKRRRRRRRKSGRGEAESGDGGETASEPANAESESPIDADSEATPKKRRRGRRGGKRNRQSDDMAAAETSAEVSSTDRQEHPQVGETTEAVAEEEADQKQKPKRGRRRREPEAPIAGDAGSDSSEVSSTSEKSESQAAEAVEEAPKPARRSRRKPAVSADEIPAPTETSAEPVVTSVVSDEATPTEPPRKEGWWKRKGFF